MQGKKLGIRQRHVQGKRQGHGLGKGQKLGSDNAVTRKKTRTETGIGTRKRIADRDKNKDCGQDQERGQG
jgi:hypothetical protein